MLEQKAEPGTESGTAQPDVVVPGPAFTAAGYPRSEPVNHRSFSVPNYTNVPE